MERQQELERKRFAAIVRQLIEQFDERQIDFAVRLDMTDRALQRWIGTKSKPIASINPFEISGDRFDQLADMLHWTPTQLKSYIKTGDRPSPEQAINLSLLMNKAPLRDVADAMVIGFGRLTEAAKIRRTVNLKSQEGDVISDTESKVEDFSMTVGTMIRWAIGVNGQAFIAATGLGESRLNEIIGNPAIASQDELEAIAHAFFEYQVTQSRWTAGHLGDLIRTTRNHSHS